MNDMAREDLLSKLYATHARTDFDYDAMMAPPLYSLIPQRDLDYLYKLVTSIKYNSKIMYKEAEIKKVDILKYQI
jgi:hypothetical protein